VTGSGRPLVAVVLAAGNATRFGSPKMVATLDGRPLLDHVLDAVRAGGIDDVIVVLGRDAADVRATVRLDRAEIVVNPRPEDGLASSLRLGFAAARRRDPEAILVALGDQPALEPSVIAALVDTATRTTRGIVAARYAVGGMPNPVIVRRAAFAIVDAATGDRGLGPILASERGLVEWVDVAGSNPDVDTPADLARMTRARETVA